MATTTITVASFQDACAECADAIASESWATAQSWYARAEAINAGLELEASNRGQSVTRRESLASLSRAIDVAKASTSRSTDRRRLIRTRCSA